MDDLISRAAALEAIIGCLNIIEAKGADMTVARTIVKGVLDNAPAVDAVNVVRCKDCKHRDPEDKKCDCGAVTVQGLYFPRPDTWYCADGERRDDNGAD